MRNVYGERLSLKDSDMEKSYQKHWTECAAFAKMEKAYGAYRLFEVRV